MGIRNIFGFGSKPSSPNAELFAKFEKQALIMSTPAQLTANRNALHDLFSSKNWNNLSLDDKKAAVQALENDFAYQQGRPAKTVEVCHLKDGCYGGWSASADKIYLNENLVKNGSLYSGEYATEMVDANIQIFDTIAHEGYHAYQTYALQNPEVHADKEQLREWALNEGRYYGKGAEYNIQPQERDAWQYGNAKTVEAFYGIENRNGTELGMEEYNAMSQMNSYSVKLAQAQSREPDVLEHMEQEMIEACEAKGINYDFSGESRSESFAAKAEQGAISQDSPPPLVNSPPEKSRAMSMAELLTPQEEAKPHKMTMDELLAPQEAPQQENVISLDEIYAEAAAQKETPQQEQMEKMSIEELLAPQEQTENPTEENIISLDEISAQVSQETAPQLDMSEKMSMDQLLAPDPSFGASAVSAEDYSEAASEAASTAVEDFTESSEQSQSYSL